jgi:hypothetical protein
MAVGRDGQNLIKAKRDEAEAAPRSFTMTRWLTISETNGAITVSSSEPALHSTAIVAQIG